MWRTKYFVIVIVFVLFASQNETSGQNSSNVTLLAHVNNYAEVGYNDVWGYIGPDGREYALLGVFEGTSIVDISDPSNPVEAAFVPGPRSLWKDIKTYRHYAYVVNETSGGLQIIDLSGLPFSVKELPAYAGFSVMHNIYVDEQNAMLYASPGKGNEPCQAISLADPTSPVLMSTFGSHNHDAYARDGLVYLSDGTGGSFSIYDVSDPSDPVHIKTHSMPDAGYVHNAWLTDNGQFLMTTEETLGKTVKLWNINDFDAIELADEYLGPNGLAHNAHIKGSYAYLSHYSGGLRIVNLDDPGSIQEEGYFTTPNAWGAWPFFRTGKILISDIESGLYVVFFEGAQDDPASPEAPSFVTAESDYTTPGSIELNWIDPASRLNGEPIAAEDFTIEISRDDQQIASVEGGAGQYTATGLTDGQFYNFTLQAKLVAGGETSNQVNVSKFAGGSVFPGQPNNLSCDVGNREDAVLTWKDPTTQRDGTPLDDLSTIRVFRNNEPIADVPAGVEIFTDTPAPGEIYSYSVTAIDNEVPANEGSSSTIVSCFVGSLSDFLVWVGPGATQSVIASGDSLFHALAENDVSVLLTDDLFEVSEDLGVYKGIFVVLGTASSKHVLKTDSPEAAALEDYLVNGGRLYLEGSDAFNYDPENTDGYLIRSWFDLGDGEENGSNLKNVSGLNDLSSFAYGYQGENTFLDILEPVGSIPIWKDAASLRIYGVFNDRFGAGSAIGVVPPFGGLTNPSAGKLGAEPVKVMLDRITASDVMHENNEAFFLSSAPRFQKAVYFPETSSGGNWNRVTPAAGQKKAEKPNRLADLMSAYLGMFGYGGDVPPIVLNPIPDQFNTVGFQPYVVADLDTVFFDPNVGGLSYSIETDGNTNARLVADGHPGKTIDALQRHGTLLEIGPAPGQWDSSFVVVKVTDDRYSVSDSFMVYQGAFQPPVVVQVIPDFTMGINFDPFLAADLSEVFMDPDGDELTYSVDTDGHTLANLTGSLLEIRSIENSIEESQIVVTARDLLFIATDTFFVSIASVTEVDDFSVIPARFEMMQNFPNPFTESTQIRFGLPERSRAKIEVYNALGQRVQTLLDAMMPAGFHNVSFDASTLESGLYLYRLQAGSFDGVKRMILIK